MPQGDLAALGLTGIEEAGYELLVERSTGTLDELRTAWRRPEDLAEVLESLVSKGVVAVDGGQRFEAVAPDVAVEDLLLAAELQLRDAREEARRLVELYREHVLGPDRNVVELVTGRTALRQRVTQVQRAARQELRCLVRPAPVDHGSTDTKLELLARGVSCRTLFDRTVVEQTGALGDVEQLTTSGGDNRVLPNVALELHLADDRLAVLPLHRGPAQVDTALVIHPSGLLDALGDLFEELWQRALPFHLADEPEPPNGGLAEPHRQRIIALLLAGLTDNAIAHQLGLSERTAQRRIAALMHELGASTRFQAGAQAAIRTRR